jgi:hypothetical protein
MKEKKSVGYIKIKNNINLEKKERENARICRHFLLIIINT